MRLCFRVQGPRTLSRGHGHKVSPIHTRGKYSLPSLYLAHAFTDALHHTFTKRDEWISHVKQNATTCYHAAGTCKMGRSDDKEAVLDEKLQVRGVTGLRVADCSVMPTLHSGHTQMPAYGIGEKAGDLIKQAWQKA